MTARHAPTMSPESRRKLTLAGMVATLLFATTGVASAHTTTYCGHSSHWHLTKRSSFVYSYTDSAGRHRHVVQTTGHLSGTSTYSWPVCG